jgi:DNA-binding transcriptional MerR regulator
MDRFLELYYEIGNFCTDNAARGGEVVLYKIGEVSKILGISSEAIRYYERQGDIKSKHVDSESGYRYYTALDVYVLMRLRMYRNCGFSVQEGSELLNHCTLEELADRMVEKQEDVKRAIEWNKRLLAAMEKMADTYRSVGEMAWRCRVENSPAMYRFRFLTQGEFLDDKRAMRQMTKWMDKMPVVALTPFFMQEDILKGNEKYGIGMCVMEEDAEFVGIDDVEVELEYLPSVPCVYTVIQADSGKELNCGMLAHVLDYMTENGMELTGDAIAKTVTTVFHSTLHERVHEVWLPFRYC